MTSLLPVSKVHLSDVDPLHVGDKKVSLATPFTAKMTSGTASSTPSSSTRDAGPKDGAHDEIEEMIEGVGGIKLSRMARRPSSVLESNIVLSEDEDPSGSGDEEVAEGDDEGLIERGPARPQSRFADRSRPYRERWTRVGLDARNFEHGEPATDYDTDAKAILTDRAYREKIDLCLDKLSDASGEGSVVVGSLGQTRFDLSGISGCCSPPDHRHPRLYGRAVPEFEDASFAPSLLAASIGAAGHTESSLLEVLSKGGFQAAVRSSSDSRNNGGGGGGPSVGPPSALVRPTPDGWPDSPGSCGNAYAASAYSCRSGSRASSPCAHSPGSGLNFHNVFASPVGSPLGSSLRNLQSYQISSSLSSDESYCETPSPTTNRYFIPDQALEDRASEDAAVNLTPWSNGVEASRVAVDSVIERELHLQLVDEFIRSDMSKRSARSPVRSQERRGYFAGEPEMIPNHGIESSLREVTSDCSACDEKRLCENDALALRGLDSAEASDALTNTLLRVVGDEQAIVSEPSGVQSSADVLTEHSARRTQQRQSIYEKQFMNLNTPMNGEARELSTLAVNLAINETWPNYSESNSDAESSANNIKFNCFQMQDQRTCTSLQLKSPQDKINESSPNKGGCGSSETQITPWAIINMPRTNASDRLKQLINPDQLHRAMCDILKKPDSVLNRQDEDGDTPLMCLVSSPQELLKKLSYLVPLIQRLGTIEGALTIMNKRGQDALFLAAMNNPQASYIVGYIAAVMVQKNININQTIYPPRGNTLIHEVASRGDSHCLVLAEILSLKTAQGNAVFDLSKCNYDGETPLHLAATGNKIFTEALNSSNISMVKLLMQGDSDPTIPDLQHGDTALHMVCSTSCDPVIVKALLLDKGCMVVNMINYDGNTPLHLAVANNFHVNLHRQCEVCHLLILAGARTNIRNRQGRIPIELVSDRKKESLLNIFYVRDG